MMFVRCLQSACRNPHTASSFRRMMSSRYPTIASRGDPRKIVTSLGIERISTMILSGKPNRPFPQEIGVDIDEMTEGGKQAINLVTTCIQMEDWENLEGLVSDDCIQGLRRNMEMIPMNSRANIAVNPKDVFFSFMTEFNFDEEKHTILLVTFSLPRYGELKELIDDNKQTFQSNMKKIHQDVKDNVMDKSQINEALNSSMQQSLDELKAKAELKDNIFRSGEIIIGNYRFERSNSNQQWTIVEVNQVDSREAWMWIFQKRWKGRLGISLRGMDFYKVLRYDYLSDWIVYLLIFNVATGSAMGAGMVSAPHS